MWKSMQCNRHGYIMHVICDLSGKIHIVQYYIIYRRRCACLVRLVYRCEFNVETQYHLITRREGIVRHLTNTSRSN